MKETIRFEGNGFKGAYIIARAEQVNLDTRVLYEAVIDLASEGLFTANCINMAAGILLEDLGLPKYFFENISKESLKHLLKSISSSIIIKDGRVVLFGQVAHVDFNLNRSNDYQRVRIATEETRDNMEKVLEAMIFGHRREYYYSPDSRYYTYIIRPETIKDFSEESFRDSRFLFSLAGNYAVTPEPTRKRYEKVLTAVEESVSPVIELFNLPETGETRIMFNSDFDSPQLPVLRKILQDHGLVLIRAYWEPYRGKASVPVSICSLYVQGELSRKKEFQVVKDLCSFLSFGLNRITKLYLNGQLTFNEMLFAGNAAEFVHMFIFQERENQTDREIMESLANKDHKDAFAARIQDSNKSTYGAGLILNRVMANPDLVKFLYDLFEKRFDPGSEKRLSDQELNKKTNEFEKIIASRFIDHRLGYDIFKFMFKFVSLCFKTNFYKPEKRSFAFRFDNRILDPLVFNQFVHGIFFVNGHYSCGTHLRAGDIARGGLRLIRVSDSNYSRELDNAVLLNYALGPKAQRLKHKDICESGSKGVVVPRPIYAGHGREALYDYTEGIMDLMLGDTSIIDYYGAPEMVFFGPDEGTAPLMDRIALNARKRGYKYWRTITTGKSFGIPHDTYGLLKNGDLFGLLSRGESGTELQINGTCVAVTRDMETLYETLGGAIEISGMTTTSIMSSFRTLISHYSAVEENLNLMMTGGPDGDLGANQIQCYKGRICLIIDGGSILFDPNGLDKKELMKLAFMRHSAPRANSLLFPIDKLSPQGFRVPISVKNTTLPDGTVVEDGAMFHRTFLTDPQNRRFIEQADIKAFIPCGGFKDTIHHNNVRNFCSLFKELQFIVEGANVFFDDASRRYIATHTKIKQIKDSSANKGGVFSSSIAEVLAAFLLQDDYETKLIKNPENMWALIRDILNQIARHSINETSMLIKIHEIDTSSPLFVLSEKTSEQIFAFQESIEMKIETLLKDTSLVWKIMEHYIPEVLIKNLGQEAIMELLNSPELIAYRNAIITKKAAAMAFYKNGLHWTTFLNEAEMDSINAVKSVFE